MKAFTEWLTVREAADRLGVTTRRVHQFVEEGRLETTRFADRVLIRRRSLEAFEQRPRPTGRPRKEG